ncbi:MAG: glycosyltransferase [Ruminococcaceae bacterium]|nr:glycosyltransferase [Oscillospiraceae bacterium]
MKKKILFIGITMNCAGSEKSFLSFVNSLDFDKYDVDLLLAKREGLFLEQIPSQVNVIEMGHFGEVFKLSSKNAFSLIFNTYIKKNPFYAFDILPYFVSLLLFKNKRVRIATKMWLHLMKKMKKVEKHYDIAVAYWGDRTMFYMIDKVDADKKITWLHFDYSFPKRDNDIYLPYFEKCDAIVNVSTTVDDALKRELPVLKDKCVVIENINNPDLIEKMANSGKSFDDGFSGKRILTVGRIAEQKGYDFAIPAFKKLLQEGYNIKWYALGGADDDYAEYIKGIVKENGVEDSFIFLGTTSNPYPYLKDCDIYAQTSRYEGKPISVEEAKIMKKTILVTNYLSASEQLENGKLGYITDISVDGVYKGLKELLDNEELSANYMKELSSRDFSNKNEIEKFYGILKRTE